MSVKTPLHMVTADPHTLTLPENRASKLQKVNSEWNVYPLPRWTPLRHRGSLTEEGSTMVLLSLSISGCQVGTSIYRTNEAWANNSLGADARQIDCRRKQSQRGADQPARRHSGRTVQSKYSQRSYLLHKKTVKGDTITLLAGSNPPAHRT